MIACPARATGRAFLPSQAWYVDFKPSGLGRDDSDGPSGPGVLQASDIICRAETILVVAMFARRSYCALNSLGVVDQSPWARLSDRRCGGPAEPSSLLWVAEPIAPEVSTPARAVTSACVRRFS